MKRLFQSILILTLFTSCSQSIYKKQMGYTKENKFITTPMSDNVLIDWNKLLKENKVKASINKL